jgi:hypothetical protein
MQNALNKFSKEIDEVTSVPTASAYCQARDKIKPEIYIGMNEVVLEDFYKEQEKPKLWHGYRLLGVDGTTINLPDLPELKKEFSTSGCRHASGVHVQALASFLYDLQNNLVINAEIGKKKGGEPQYVYNNHIAFMKADDLVIFDRGYSDYRLLATLFSQNIAFLIRFQRKNTFKVVEKFLASSSTDEIVEIKVPVGRQKEIKTLGLPEVIKIRLVKNELESGEIEILGTSLLNSKEYSIELLDELYFKRWGVEVYFDKLKNIFEVELFSSGKLNNILQDFYGMVFLTNLENVFSEAVNEELLAEGKEKNRKYLYKVNNSIGYSTLVDYITELFFGKKKRSQKKILQEIFHLFKTRTIPVIPERKYPRKSLRASVKLRYEKYKKKIIS